MPKQKFVFGTGTNDFREIDDADLTVISTEVKTKDANGAWVVDRTETVFVDKPGKTGVAQLLEFLEKKVQNGADFYVVDKPHGVGTVKLLNDQGQEMDVQENYSEGTHLKGYTTPAGQIRRWYVPQQGSTKAMTGIAIAKEDTQEFVAAASKDASGSRVSTKAIEMLKMYRQRTANAAQIFAVNEKARLLVAAKKACEDAGLPVTPEFLQMFMATGANQGSTISANNIAG